MSILFNKQAGIFKLDALDTSYIIGIFDDESLNPATCSPVQILQRRIGF